MSQLLQKIELEDVAIDLFCVRLDNMDAEIQGNKWFKLKYNLERAQKDGYSTLLTFGGAYSNHLRAVAAAGKYFDFKTIGIVRGEEHSTQNPTIEKIIAQGMQIHYCSREEYRHKNELGFIEDLKRKFGLFYLIPEGGSNALSVKGAKEILSYIDIDFDYILCAVGTGGTMAGLISGIQSSQKVIGISVLKNAHFLNLEVQNLLDAYHEYHYPKANWEILLDYHWGGYAKSKPELISFIEEAQNKFQIPLEFVYTGKLFYAALDLIKRGYFPSGSRIVVVHSGGIF